MPLPYSNTFYGSPLPAGSSSSSVAWHSWSCQPGWHLPLQTHLPDSFTWIFCISQIGSTPRSLNTLWAFLPVSLCHTTAHSPLWLLHFPFQAQQKVQLFFQEVLSQAVFPWAVAASCEVWPISSEPLPYLFIFTCFTHLHTAVFSRYGRHPRAHRLALRTCFSVLSLILLPKKSILPTQLMSPRDQQPALTLVCLPQGLAQSKCRCYFWGPSPGLLALTTSSVAF